MTSPGSFPAGAAILGRWESLTGVAAAVESSRDMVDRVLVHRMVVARTPAVAAESALRGARAAAALVGDDVELEAVRAAAVPPGPVLAGALRAYAELPRLRSVWRSSPRQALARLHLLAAADLADPADLGRPGSAGAAAALAAIAGLASARTSAPAVVVAAVVHAELVAAEPFPVGTQVVACAVFRLVLAERGLDPGMLTVPEAGLVELPDTADKAQAYSMGDSEAVAAWLRHCCAAVELGARETLAVAEAMARG